MHNPDPEPLLCSHVEAKGVEGSIPPGGWPLPASLTGLYLDGNNISGPIPEDFSLPEGLLVLLLSSNQLSALPKRSFLPPSLTVLWVSNCGWAACVPVLLGSHTSNSWFGGGTAAVRLPCCHRAAAPGSLHAPEALPLQLSDNQLANDVADLAGWRWPTTLLELYLGNNRLRGSLPAAFVAALPRGLQVAPYARVLQPEAITCRRRTGSQ